MNEQIWSPDTCECKIKMSKDILDKDGNLKFIEIINTCEEHKNLKGEKLYKQVIIHNSSFNTVYGELPTREQRDIMHDNKRKEKDRIKKLRKKNAISKRKSLPK